MTPISSESPLSCCPSGASASLRLCLRNAALPGEEDGPCLGMHPCDMRHRGLAANDLLILRAADRTVFLRAAPGVGLRRGEASVLMSEMARAAGGGLLVQLPTAADGSLSGEVDKVAAGYPLCAICRYDSVDEAEAARNRVSDFGRGFDYASARLAGKGGRWLVWRAVARYPLSREQLVGLDACLGVAVSSSSVRYEDAQRQIDKAVQLEGGEVVAVRLAGEAVAFEWLKTVLPDGLLPAGQARLALAPVSRLPETVHQQGGCGDGNGVVPGCTEGSARARKELPSGYQGGGT